MPNLKTADEDDGTAAEATDLLRASRPGTGNVFLTLQYVAAFVWSVWGALINSGAEKTTPVDADELSLMDSEEANATKKLTWANLKDTLKTYFDTLYAPLSRVGMPFEKELSLSDLTTALTTGTTKAYWRPTFAASAVTFRASLRVASSSGIPTVDVNKNATSMMSTKLTIDVSELTSVTAAAAVVMSTTTWAADDLLEFDIDVAGTGAMGLIVTATGLYA